MSGLFEILLNLFAKPTPSPLPGNVTPTPTPVPVPPPDPKPVFTEPEVVGPQCSIYRNCRIEQGRANDVAMVGKLIVGNRARYEEVDLGIPWYVIGMIHQRECSGNFNQHLHNGDPLSARTKHVPMGRPVSGEPPFTWLDSARDALIFDRLDHKASWTLEETLDRLERYNGLGYRQHGIRSPYLWGATTAQRPGKYTADGHLDPAVYDKQVGCAAVLKWLEALGHVQL